MSSPFNFEATVLSWSESSKGGAKAVLQIHPNDLAIVKGLIGIPVLMVVVPIGSGDPDDGAKVTGDVQMPVIPGVLPIPTVTEEVPAPSARSGGYKSLRPEVAWLVQRCKEPEFLEYTKNLALWNNEFRSMREPIVAAEGLGHEKASRDAWLAFFGASSRSDLTKEQILFVMNGWQEWRKHDTKGN